MTEAQQKVVIDPGLDEAEKALTPERIEAVVNEILDKETAARFKVYLNTCVHCALCSNACHWYLSNDSDPRYSPVGKVKQTLWEILKRRGKGTITPQLMKECARVAFTECNVCRRCSMYCPFGIDIAYLLLVVRRICSKLGMVPQFLQDTVNSHAVTSNQMWVKQDEWIDTLQWQEDEASFEMKNAAIPLDRRGAEIMYSVIAPEPKILAQLINNMAQIFTVVGADWTMPSRDGWDNSNMAMYSGDFETMARVERYHYEAAFDLKVKKIVMGECGHAFRGAAYDGPKWLSWKNPPVPLIHAVEYYHELMETGKLKINGKIEEPVTVQDPCNIVRGRGLGRKAPGNHADHLLRFPGVGSPVRTQLLLRSWRRRHQLRASLEAGTRAGKPCQGRSVEGLRRIDRRYPVPQLPQRHRRHRARIPPRHAGQVLERTSDHGDGDTGGASGLTVPVGYDEIHGRGSRIAPLR